MVHAFTHTNPFLSSLSIKKKEQSCASHVANGGTIDSNRKGRGCLYFACICCLHGEPCTVLQTGIGHRGSFFPSLFSLWRPSVLYPSMSANWRTQMTSMVGWISMACTCMHRMTTTLASLLPFFPSLPLPLIRILNHLFLRLGRSFLVRLSWSIIITQRSSSVVHRPSFIFALFLSLSPSLFASNYPIHRIPSCYSSYQTVFISLFFLASLPLSSAKW